MGKTGWFLNAQKEYTLGNTGLGGFLRRKAKLDSLQGNRCSPQVPAEWMAGYAQEERGLLKLGHSVIWSHSHQQEGKETGDLGRRG